MSGIRYRDSSWRSACSRVGNSNENPDLPRAFGATRWLLRIVATAISNTWLVALVQNTFGDERAALGTRDGYDSCAASRA